MKLARGYRGGRSKLFCTARESVDRALRYSYIHRKQKKRDFRALDPADQRRGARLRSELQPVYQWPEQGGNTDKPKSAGGYGGERSSGF